MKINDEITFSGKRGVIVGFFKNDPIVRVDDFDQIKAIVVDKRLCKRYIKVGDKVKTVYSDFAGIVTAKENENVYIVRPRNMNCNDRRRWAYHIKDIELEG